MTSLLMGSAICKWIVFKKGDYIMENFLEHLLRWVVKIGITIFVLLFVLAIKDSFSMYPVCETATVLNGRRELVYIDKSEIKIGPDNIYYYDRKGHYTNSEAKGYIIYNKKENSIIYREGDYYAGFKLGE